MLNINRTLVSLFVSCALLAGCNDNSSTDHQNPTVNPVEPAKPVDPITPVNPNKPDDEKPVKPINPVVPTNPSDNGTPVKPVDPVNPITPIDPVKPVDPVTPVDPNKPDPTNPDDKDNPQAANGLPYLSDWVDANSEIKKDPAIEAQVQQILAQMTLAEKVGQMIQPDLREITPAEAKEYKIGSILNGGGGFPNNNKYSTAQDWANEADKYWLALEEAYAERGFRVPFMWATDAVHGHNNVFKATVYPHNIGLGAARDPALIEKIGEATAREVAATGLDWTFAPTVATPRDYRWGRVYEGYSEDPEIVYEYAQRMVKGIQGGEQGLKGDTHVISNVKHWIGDGGTFGGVDHGQNRYTEEYLRNIHSMGYFGGLKAGAQVVMSSFNSWWNSNNYDPMGSGNYANNQKIHGSRYLITDVLKNKMGFDGIVVTDWNGQGEINGCTAANCPQAVIAGNDVFMVTSRGDWKAFYQNVINQVNSGVIPMERIDDAVTRILRVKMRANLWNKPKPSERSLAGKQAVLGAPEHIALARQAVAESLVLLKNENAVLPLQKDKKYLVVGSAANDIAKQTGGWSLSWQGDGNVLEKDFPSAQTLLMAMQTEVGGSNVVTDINAVTPEQAIAVVAIGEDPYAEMFGDISKTQTLEYASLKAKYKQDLETIKTLKSKGFKVVTVFYSGRPLYVNEELNHSDAFVAAWLPGTEGLGITDVLFAKNGADFKGKLSYSWPAMKCSTTINRKAPNLANYQTPVDGASGTPIEQDISGEHAPLFPYGYGLHYSGKGDVAARFDNLNQIPLDPRDYGCGTNEPDSGVASSALEIFGKDAKDGFKPYISGSANGWAGEPVTKDTTTIGSITTKGINYDGMQQSALNVVFTGKKDGFETNSAAQFYLQTADKLGIDLSQYKNANATLEFDIRMVTPAPESLILATHCEYPCRGEVKINRVLPAPSADWKTMKVPLACFAENGMNFQLLNTSFLLFSQDAVEFDVGKVRFVPHPNGLPADAVSCEQMNDVVAPALTGSNYQVFADFNASLDTSDQYSTTNWQRFDANTVHMQANMQADGAVQVNYNPASPEHYKGLLHINFAPQNLESFNQEGWLELVVNVQSLGAQDVNAQVNGLVLKVENSAGKTTGDMFPEPLMAKNIVLNQDVTVKIPVSELANRLAGEKNIRNISNIVLFPAWGNNQAGFNYTLKSLAFKK